MDGLHGEGRLISSIFEWRVHKSTNISLVRTEAPRDVLAFPLRCPQGRAIAYAAAVLRFSGAAPDVLGTSGAEVVEVQRVTVHILLGRHV
jgi:hypothetical protein